MPQISVRSIARPRVASFYSYKGGVGRTLLAANVAVAMAARGKTLIWDLDVEAPGIQYIPALRPSNKVREGFLEWLRDWLPLHASRTSGSSGNGKAEGRRCLSDEDRQRFSGLVRGTRIHQLFCIPALSATVDPAEVYQAIDWTWFQREPVAALNMFDRLLGELREQGFEHVIIDCRTGYTDLGAMLAGLLPDVCVLVGGYGQQNVHGLARIWSALKNDRPEFATMRAGRSSPKLELVASPIPQHDLELASEGRKRWASEFGLDLASIHEIPFDHELPFTEKLMISAEPNREISRQYAQVAQAVMRHFDATTAEEMAMAVSTPTAPSRAFEDRVRKLLNLLDYQTDAVAPDAEDQGFDLRASLKVGLEEVQYLIECTASPATKTKVIRLAQSLKNLRQRNQALRAMIVTAGSASDEARAFAANEGIRMLSLEDLEQQLLDPEEYLRSVTRQYEVSPLLEGYVVPRVVSSNSEADASPVAELADASVRWARGEGPSTWIICGEAGTGKSTYAARACYEIAKAAIDNPLTATPILVRRMEARRSASSIFELLSGRWYEATGTRKSPAVFEHLLRRQRVAAILDGFDELAGNLTDFRGAVTWTHLLDEAFAQKSEARLLVTCRQDPRLQTNHIVGSNLTVTRLAGLSPADLVPSVSFRLKPRDIGRLAELVSQNSGDSSASRWFDAIRIAGPALGKKPLEAMSPALLNRVMLDTWIGSVVSSDQNERDRYASAIEELAWLVWSREARWIDFEDVRRLGGLREIDPSSFLQALKRMPFLLQSSTDRLEFLHFSILEFAVAQGILRRSNATTKFYGLAELFDVPSLSDGIVQSLHELVRDDSTSRNRLAKHLESLLLVSDIGSQLENARVKRNTLMLAHGLALREAGGSNDQARVRACCNRYIPRHAFLEGVSLEAMTLVGIALPAARLARANLDAADLSGADLREASLDGASLRQARIVDVHFGKATLTHADLTGAIVENVNLEDASLEGSVWRASQIGPMNVSNAKFTGVDLSNIARIDRATKKSLSGMKHGPKEFSGPAQARASRRISLDEPHEVSYWSRGLGVSEEVLRAAVAKVGPRPEVLFRYFREGTGAPTDAARSSQPEA